MADNDSSARTLTAEPERQSFGTRARTRLRELAQGHRRFAQILLLLAPLAFVVLVDIKLRGDRLIELSPKYMASYAAAMLESGICWGLLLFAASARRGVYRWIAATLFVALATVAIGGQIYFHRQYSIYLNLDAVLFSTSVSDSVFGQLRADSSNFLASVLPPLVCATILVWLGRTFIRPTASLGSRLARFAAPVAVVALFVIPCSYRKVQASTPDVIYFHALGGLVKELSGDHKKSEAEVRPGLRTPPHMPALKPAHVPKRNVLFIITESVRADVACSAPSPDCATQPQVNRAVPERLPLLQMRSNASTTAIELAVMWSGLQPIASRYDLHTAPLIYDYAHAAGIENAYWTSHHMMFANSRLYVQDLPTSHQTGATDLDPLADIDLGARDELLTERIKGEIGTMKEPFLAVAHFGNTHVPYLVDPDDAPFQPALESRAPDDHEAYRNYYKNAIYRQDKAIGELIRFVKQSSFGDHTVIVFTSDHGEAFYEHGQICHTGSLYDEEIHVPFWIDAPRGTLRKDERKTLAELRDEPVFHTDVTPTILDLLGLYDAPEIASYKSAMVGSSLLRPRPSTPVALALTNCTGIWGCAFRNWGMMRGSLKLLAREWDNKWRCHDVLSDPREEHDLGPEGCGELTPLAEQIYGGLPSTR